MHRISGTQGFVVKWLRKTIVQAMDPSLMSRSHRLLPAAVDAGTSNIAKSLSDLPPSRLTLYPSPRALSGEALFGATTKKEDFQLLRRCKHFVHQTASVSSYTRCRASPARNPVPLIFVSFVFCGGGAMLTPPGCRVGQLDCFDLKICFLARRPRVV